MRTRRGLSSVVGMVFAIIALTSVVTYVSYSMNTLNQYNQSILSKDQTVSSQASEKFQIANVNLANNRLNVTIANVGTIPVNITKIWIQNTTAFGQGTDWTLSYAPSNKIAGPGSTVTNIGQSMPGTINPLYAYQIKIVTSRGNAQEFNLNSIGSAPLMVQFNAIPNQIPPTFTTTLVMIVTNNMTGNTYLTNVQGRMVGLPVFIGSGTTNVQLLSQQTTSYPVLGPGNTAIFKWVYEASGAAADQIKFTAGVVGSSYQYSDTVTLQNPLNAAFSANSLTSQGITCCRTNDNLLVLHDEKQNTATIGTSPNQVTAYQMYEGSVDSTGTTINLKNENTNPQNRAYFITENDTINQVDVQPGAFSIVMKYQSAPVPNSITNFPDMVFYFNALQSNVPFDSASTSCTKSTATLGGTNGATPSFDQTSQDERDGSPLFSFDGSKTEYIDIAKNNGGGGCTIGPAPGVPGHGNDLNTQASTTTGWFKVTSSQKPPSGQKAVILREEGNNQWYEVSMDSSGHVSFNFQINTGPGLGTISCVTTGNYADGNWHFFAAIRPSGESCVLDMDGGTYSALNGNQFTDIIVGHAGDKFAMTTDMFIGRSPTTTQQAYYPFTGLIDNIMHWNNNDYLTDGTAYTNIASNQVNDLYNKNYGSAAHTIIASMVQTDKLGSTSTTPNAQILSPTTIALPFYDSKQLSSTTWQNFTYTTPNLTNSSDQFGEWHFIPNTRLLLNITWAGTTTLHPEALPMSWRINDPTTGDLYDSWLLIPQLNTPFPSYFTFSHNNSYVSFTVSNSGPNGIWVSLAGTRITCQTMIGGTSYAGILQAVNGTGNPPAQNIDPATDSMFVPDGKKIILTFNQLSSIPQQGGVPKGTTIVAGTYRMYIAVAGYDDTGAAINKNFYVGVVHVT